MIYILGFYLYATRNVDADLKRGDVTVVEVTSPEGTEQFEVMPSTGFLWTKDGQQADWRKTDIDWSP